jgi:hypothetical protein
VPVEVNVANSGLGEVWAGRGVRDHFVSVTTENKSDYL